MATPASTSEALEMILDALGYLSGTDPAAAATESQAECLRALERAAAVSTAVRADTWAPSPQGRVIAPMRTTARRAG